MYFSDAERVRRHDSIRGMLAERDVDALVIVGRPGVGSSQVSGHGYFRYLTDFVPLFDVSLALFFAESDPVQWEPTSLGVANARQHSWIKDVRLGIGRDEQVAEEIARRLGAKGRLGAPRVGTIPTGIVNAVRELLPGWTGVDVGRALTEIENRKSAEELNAVRQAASANDAAYNAFLDAVVPGILPEGLVGIAEQVQRAFGADQTFNQMRVGRFPSGPDDPLPNQLFHVGGGQLRDGDVVIVELSTVAAGYWNQVVRAICVGTGNSKLEEMHTACLDVRDAGLAVTGPATKPGVCVDVMRRRAEALGLTLRPPAGHFCGLDLVEDRIDEDAFLSFQEGSCFILHPTLTREAGEVLFWGETYVIGAAGPERVNQATDDLLIVSRGGI